MVKGLVHSYTRRLLAYGLSARAPCASLILCLCGGCGNLFSNQTAPLFVVPLAVEGKVIGTALVDTGGGYEVMLRKNFGLEVVDSVDVVAFGGIQRVDVTEGFAYTAGGVESETRGAIIGEGICDCNGLGFHFFRRTGKVLLLDFSRPTVAFVTEAPRKGVTIAYDPPPEQFASFDTAFLRVTVRADGSSRNLTALLDTGASATVMRRGLLASRSGATLPTNGKLTVSITRSELDTVVVNVGLFDTVGLPDIILGTDVMRAWGDQWYFSFAPGKGAVTVVQTGEN